MTDSDQVEPNYIQAQLGLEDESPKQENSQAKENLKRQELLDNVRVVFDGFNIIRYVAKSYRDKPIDLERDFTQHRTHQTQPTLTGDLTILEDTLSDIDIILGQKPLARETKQKIRNLAAKYKDLNSAQKDEAEEAYDTHFLFQDLSLQALQDLEERLHTPFHDLRTPITTIKGRFQMARKILFRSLEDEAGSYHDFAQYLKKLNPHFVALYKYFGYNLDVFVRDMEKPKLEIKLEEMVDQINDEVVPIFVVFSVKDYQVVNEIPEEISREQILVKSDLNRFARATREVGNNIGKALDEQQALEPGSAEKQARIIFRLSDDRQFIEVVFRTNGRPYPDKFVYIPNDPSHPGDFIKGEHGRQTEITGVPGSGMAMYEHQQELRKVGGDIVALNPPDGGSETIIRIPLIGWQHRLPL